MLPLTMVHDLVMTFPEDSQGGKASYVVIPAQIYLGSAVNLHSHHAVLVKVPLGDDERGGRGQHGGPTAFVSPSLCVMYGILTTAAK